MKPSLSRIGAIALFMLLACGFGAPAQACTPSGATVVTTTFPNQSPAAIRQGVVTPQPTRAGIKCNAALVVILTNNYIRGKFTSANNMKLMNGTNAISYLASPNQAQTVTFTQNGTTDYMQAGLNIAGLLAADGGELAIYVKPSSSVVVPEGLYTDRITMAWSWYLCPSIGIGNICLTTPVQGSGASTIDIKLTVEAKRMVITTSARTTWDPVNLTTYPKSLPDARQRIIASVANPDIAAIDADKLVLSLPVPPKTIVALDGDKSGTAGFVLITDGTPTSRMTLTYTSPSSTTDDVDFSSDNGQTWTYVPTLGSDVSQAAVTNIRLRPHGSMAPSSSFSVSYPVRVK